LAEITRKQREADKAADVVELAKAGVAVAQRRAVEEEAAQAARIERAKAEILGIARRKEVDAKRRFRNWLVEVQSQSLQWETELRAIADDLPYTEGYRPARWQSWGALTNGIADQLSRLPAPPKPAADPKPTPNADASED
jgi:hypothetical protein